MDNLSFAESTQKIEDKKISFLIKQVKDSGAIFHRNGTDHSAQEAADHLETKMKRARRQFGFFGGKINDMSALQFIEKIASKSSVSGRPYLIKMNNGKKVEAEKWFKQRLQEFKSQP